MPAIFVTILISIIVTPLVVSWDLSVAVETPRASKVGILVLIVIVGFGKVCRGMSPG